MTEYKVIFVVDGDTFKVKKWEWDNHTGNVIRPTGYDTPERGEDGYQETKKRLMDLILNQIVQITSEKIIDKWGRLVADVSFNGKKLADYFPEYKKRRHRTDDETAKWIFGNI